MFIYSSLYTVTRYHVSHLQESSAIKKPVYGLLDAVSDEVANDNEETYFNRIYSSYVSGHGGGGESSLVPSPSVYVHFYSHIICNTSIDFVAIRRTRRRRQEATTEDMTTNR